MENFDYKKYLKNNPLLKEDLGRTGDSLGYEGGGIPDSDVKDEDHEHEWEDTGDEEGMFTGEEECKVCGLRRSVYEEDIIQENPQMEAAIDLFKMMGQDEKKAIESAKVFITSVQKEGLDIKKISKSQLKEAIKKIIKENI